MEKLYKVALTGGPAGGKSTLSSAIAEQIPETYCVDEVATMLLSGGFPMPSDQHPWDNDWQRDFQTAVIGCQYALETVSQRRATQEKKSIIVYDRGLLDNAAYLSGATKELEELTGASEHEMLSRYDMVLHLTTSAAHSEYTTDSNPYRFEEKDKALELDQRITDVWVNHHNRIVLDEQDEMIRIGRGLRIIKGIL